MSASAATKPSVSATILTFKTYVVSFDPFQVNSKTNFFALQAVYQCLYSQCHTSQFGIALHHALGLCSKPKGAQTTSSIPALIRQQENLKKRGGMQSVSNSRSASVSNSNYRSNSNSVRYTRTASVSASQYMSYSMSRASPPPEPTYSMAPPPEQPTYTMMVSQISDGQIQAPTWVTQITDGQVQAPTYAAMLKKQ